jgi:hypothetical protein
MKQVTVTTYRQDPYYPRVVRAVATILARSDVVAPVEVLLEMGNLTPKNYEAWSRGHVPYLERVFAGSLSKANRLLRLIGFHVHDLNMLPRRTVYHQWGQGTNRLLRFSKSGHQDVEKAEFIPIKSWVTKGAGAPGNCAGHNRVPSPDHGCPLSTGGAGLSQCDNA